MYKVDFLKNCLTHSVAREGLRRIHVSKNSSRFLSHTYPWLHQHSTSPGKRYKKIGLTKLLNFTFFFNINTSVLTKIIIKWLPKTGKKKRRMVMRTRAFITVLSLPPSESRYWNFSSFLSITAKHQWISLWTGTKIWVFKNSIKWLATSNKIK